jgi:hypothetical protein
VADADRSSAQHDHGASAWLSRVAPVSGRTVAIAGIVVLILIGTALRVAAIGTNDRVSSDENGDIGNANSILAHERYRTLRWAPGTPLLFAVATRVTGKRQMKVAIHSHQAAQYAQLAAEIAMLVLAGVLAWLIAGAWAAVIGVALCALYIPLILITRTYLSEPFGGLMILATFAAAAWARRRGWREIVAAGVLAGLACLTREDLFPGVVVIALAMALAMWRTSRRRALSTTGLYLACSVLVITPWVIYASHRDGRFVPITDGGASAFFIGSYLPGHGEQFDVEKSFKGVICSHSATLCRQYAKERTAAVFAYLASEHPRLSPNAAVTQADFENIEKYAFGRPLAFAGMLIEKVWRMWSEPWSGGNNSRHPDTSRVQHLIFIALALIGLLGGAAMTRRWSLVTVAAALAVMTVLNVLVNAQGRDNLRFDPLVFTFGAAGLVLVAQRAARRVH